MARSTPRPRFETLTPTRVADPKLVIPLLYTINDAAHLLSFSPRTVLRLINDGELTAIGLGRMRRVPHAEIEAYIERNRREVS